MLVNLLWRLLGAFIGLIIGAVLAVVLGDQISKALHISNFEGGRGYFVFLVLIPLFALTGVILGAIMIRASWRFNVGAILVLLVVAGVFVLTHKDAFIAPPPKMEHLGNFDLLTYTSEDWGDYYALRYRGQPFQVTGPAGLMGDKTATYTRFNSIITFTVPISIPTPVFVVNAADPNNKSYFHLIREVNGQATATPLCATSGNVSADWLDVAPSDPTARRNMVISRKALEGGRWLLLGDACVLDAQTLTAYEFPTSPLQDGSDAYPDAEKLPIVLAPDQHSFVRVGSSEVRDANTGDFRGTVAHLIVYDFVDRTSYSLPVERARMRYNLAKEIDAAWLDHHFEWQRTPNAHDRLVARRTFTPFPYHGHLLVDGDYREVQLVPVKPAMLDASAKLLTQEFKAVPAGAKKTDETSEQLDIQINGQTVHLDARHDGYSDSQVVLWLERGGDSRLVETIAERVDEALKTGQYDDLFLGDPIAK
ncbi:MAG: hypothetical protein U0350_36060 [Caldilineaceae bacterium]